MKFQRFQALKFFILALVIAAGGFHTTPTFAIDIEEEIKIGKEAAAQVEKESKFITDETLVKRVQDIGMAIAKVACQFQIKPSYGSSAPANFQYSFKIIDDKDVNAFALPGGFVYINKGLLDYVQSDDELAAVIAHEIAHVAHHHALQLNKAQQKAMLGMMAAILAGKAAGMDISDTVMIANLINTAKMSGYGQKAELDADRTAVAYLTATKFNPTGMLTFMERLARDEGRKPSINWGIFATHPPAYLRAREITSELEARGIKINRRLVTSYLRVQVKPTEVNGIQAADVSIGDVLVIRTADSGGKKAITRAEEIAAKIETALLAGAGLHDIKLEGGGQYVTIKGKVIIHPSAEDAELSGKSIADVTSDAHKALKKALWMELYNQAY
ncbi:MAG: M48 family metalloprotease [Armatimonadota bacterium]|nr:M48 family metalloprotease [Armatimonadota bacterium]